MCRRVSGGEPGDDVEQHRVPGRFLFRREERAHQRRAVCAITPGQHLDGREATAEVAGIQLVLGDRAADLRGGLGVRGHDVVDSRRGQ